MVDWLQRNRGYVILTLTYTIVLGGVLFFVVPDSNVPPVVVFTPTLSPTSTLAPIKVHVSGAVANPGVYSLPDGSRVCDALEAAGGASDEAAVDLLNLAAWVSDGQKVHVPVEGEVELPALRLGGDGAGSTDGGGKININRASAEELDTLPGVGPAYAERIVRYREEHGSFESIDQIMEVQGIGPACFEDIKDLICVR